MTHRGASAPAACYTEGRANPGDIAILRDNREIPLPQAVIQALGKTINSCNRYTKAGYGVDCRVFGTLAMQGLYIPVDDRCYGHESYTRIGYGHWLGTREASAPPSYMRMIQFGRLSNDTTFRTIHTAIQLPWPDLYVQQLGRGSPVALTSAEANVVLYDTNAAATVTSLAALNGRRPVLLMADPHEQETFGQESGVAEWL